MQINYSKQNSRVNTSGWEWFLPPPEKGINVGTINHKLLNFFKSKFDSNSYISIESIYKLQHFIITYIMIIIIYFTSYIIYLCQTTIKTILFFGLFYLEFSTFLISYRTDWNKRNIRYLIMNTAIQREN